MSRSNPTQNSNPNPATRWFEWNAGQGSVRYYDRDLKKNIDLGDDFIFILLDQLAKVGGWHNDSDSGIYSNEVRDTRQEPFVVKAFKGGTLAEGFYRDIKDKVNAAGGHYVANCYIGYKDDSGPLVIGALEFKGAALHAWTEFAKEHRPDLYKKAIRIQGSHEGKRGKVVYKTPKLSLRDITPELDAAAMALDETLQAYLASYLKQPTADRVEASATPEPEHVSDEEMGQLSGSQERVLAGGELRDDDIPWG